MSVMSGPSSTGLVARVQNILLRPAAEWDVIAAEPASVGSLYTGYACILAAIPAVASILGTLLFGRSLLVFGIVMAILTYVISLVTVFVVAFIIDALATNFGAQKNQIQALKLVVYSFTASWVAGILDIVPALGLIAALAGFYSLYLLYLGLPKLMLSPPDKTTGYFVVSLLIAIGVNVVLSWIVFLVGLSVGGAALMGAAAVH